MTWARRLLAGLALLCLPPHPVLAEPLMEVFLTSLAGHQPLRHPPGFTVRIYALDAPEQLESQLPAFTGRDAEARARRWAERHARPLARRVRAAHQGRLKALDYGVVKVPAVVFDGEYVVYGATDLGRAARLYRHAVEQGR